ncbi:diguanylate cyclase (GGDEF) domain-containing protein [Micromonospora pattaloongensis]|uniref:Diguanylate cyclase (GGDEF) domain-containing protein n=1 Tax=Micromonospora pattaloongensis TaxID=405436 RepID=A0A1H3TAM7_9ACTN|nr:bifunctional diguanylate cyclase/phosphodiesterase [Micromonospora pattaloongensis]SDZ47264.1 diguanylate cyclase (GGDEF) domain-containing protein [Micromonospora pattaloongensis]
MLSAVADVFGDTSVRQVLWLVVCALGSSPFFFRIARGWRGLSLPWRLVAAGFAVRLLSDTVWTVEYVSGGNDAPFPSYNDVGFVASYVLLIAGLVLAGRQRRGQGRRMMLDALIVSAGFAVLDWVFLFHPYLHQSPLAGLGPILALIYPLCDLALFAATVKLLFSASARSPANRLVLLAVGAMLAANTVYFSNATATTRTVDVLDNGLWMVSYLLLGLAGLHPAMLWTARPGTNNRTPLSSRRTLAFAVATLIGPASLLGMAATTDADAWHAEEWRHLAVPALLSGALSVLLVVRLSLVARVAQHRSVELDRRTVELDQQARDLAEALEERTALEQQLRHHALHDPLTGLANRGLLAERMEWAFSRRDGAARHALLLIDLDGFKDVNDTLGHGSGDELLMEVAVRLRELAAPADTLARLGGDEFALFIEDVEPVQAAYLAERAREAIKAPLPVAGRTVYLSASIGLVQISDTRVTPQNALADADLALYAAKRAGRDRVTAYQPVMRTARETFTWVADGLRHALATEELAVHYQPVMDLATGRAVAVEALLRWTLSARGPVSPAQFIPVAEETGLIVPVGAWVLRRACTDARAWYERYGISLTVNVSGRQLAELDFADLVLRTLTDVGLPPEALILEITETVLIGSAEEGAGQALATLNRLREHGVRIAIDDFGTGYSSLSYLAQLPVDILKIDRSFVPAAEAASGDDHAFTRAVLQLGASRRLPAIAEGVETAEQADLLRDMGCPLAQGFLFARPGPVEVVAAELARTNGDRAGDDRPGGSPVGSGARR